MTTETQPTIDDTIISQEFFVDILRNLSKDRKAGSGLNHVIRDNITESVVNGQKIDTYCGFSFYPRAMSPNGSVSRKDWARCAPCDVIYMLEHNHGINF